MLRCCAVAFILLVLAGVWSCAGSDGTSPDPGSSTPAEVVVTPERDTLDWIGATVQLSAFVRNDEGDPLIVTPSWSSSATSVATVSASGLVTATGVGTASIAATAGTVTGRATIVVRQVPAALTKVSGDLQSGPAQQLLAQPLVVEVRDQGGAAVPGVALTWTVTAGAGTLQTSSTLTAADGRGQATWKLGAAAGEQTVQVSVGSLAPVTFSATATEPSPVVITGVEPAPLVEGQPATIRGAGFAAAAGGNVVTVDGLAATVLSATATELHVTVPRAACKPPRRAAVKVVVGADSASAETGITPDSVVDLEVGEVTYGSQCVHLTEATGNRFYLVGVSSLSETPSNLTPAVLSTETGSPLPLLATGASGRVAFEPDVLARALAAAPRPARFATGRLPTGPAADRLRRHRRAEAEWRELERRTLRPLLDRARSDRHALSIARSVPVPRLAIAATGDTITLNMPPADGNCATVTPLKAVVRYVGTSTIWVEDIANPVESFTAAELAALDQDYTQKTRPVLTSYFGTDVDVDGNSRIIIFLTREVNRRDGILGFVTGVDLVPTTYCARSNQAEIYYGIVPDPSGTVGDPLTKEEVLALYPWLMAHEITHVLQMTQVVYGGAELKATWEREGGATLAEQLVGFSHLGHQPGQDLGLVALIAGEDWYFNWVVDLAVYFGFDGTAHIPFAPEQCSWMGTPEEGNTGPCENSRAVYGVPATLLRLVLDRWGATYPGGESALMRQLTGSSAVGLANLAAATGEAKDWIHTLFAATLWGDGRFFNTLTSWNIHDIFSGLIPATRLVPYTDSGTAPALSVSVRAGSTAYLEWTPPANHPPASLRITTPGGGVLPSNMHLWVLRVQ